MKKLYKLYIIIFFAIISSQANAQTKLLRLPLYDPNPYFYYECDSFNLLQKFDDGTYAFYHYINEGVPDTSYQMTIHGDTVWFKEFTRIKLIRYVNGKKDGLEMNINSTDTTFLTSEKGWLRRVTNSKGYCVITEGQEYIVVKAEYYKNGFRDSVWTYLYNLKRGQGIPWKQVRYSNGLPYILNAWDSSGKQTLFNGNGNLCEYRRSSHYLSTTPHINGVPEGRKVACYYKNDSSVSIYKAAFPEEYLEYKSYSNDTITRYSYNDSIEFLGYDTISYQNNSSNCYNLKSIKPRYNYINYSMEFYPHSKNLHERRVTKFTKSLGEQLIKEFYYTNGKLRIRINEITKQREYYDINGERIITDENEGCFDDRRYDFSIYTDQKFGSDSLVHNEKTHVSYYFYIESGVYYKFTRSRNSERVDTFSNPNVQMVKGYGNIIEIKVPVKGNDNTFLTYKYRIEKGNRREILRLIK